ncbi:MAG: S9 family peptidase [Acidobacteria bacterium]|nr:S9 family peptidase [Acidobacteriota bacterium]
MRLGPVVVAAAGCLGLPAQAFDSAMPRSAPAFSLEQSVQVRTIGPVAVSRDGRLAAFGLAGHYFGFPVIPRFGYDNNLRVLALDTGELRYATSGVAAKTRPVFSPGNDALAYESEDDIWHVRLADGRTTRVTTNGGRDTGATWSPDGRRLAFVSTREGSTDIWIATIEGERHGINRVTSDGMAKEDPQWSPDGQRIVYTARGPLDFYAQGVFVVPAAGGTSQRITPNDGFDHSQARWSPDGRRLAFVSDRAGYMHVWTMEPDGGQPEHFDTGRKDSTSPHFDVRPVWSPDGRRILVSANSQGRYELMVLTVSNRSHTVVRNGPGQFHEAGWRHDGEIVYVHENAWSPPDVYVGPERGGGRQLTFSSHVAFREAHTARMERVAFRSTDGLEIHAWLLSPRAAVPAVRLPAIVALHPNGYGQFYDHWNPFFHFVAQSGYALLLVDQRGSSGYGREFRRAQIGNWGTGTFEDVRAAAAFIKSRSEVDPGRVGVMGLSFGGYQTLLALTRTPDLFKAGVNLMGPSDRRGRPGDRYRQLQIGASEKDDPALYERISPIASVAAIRSPILIIHSDQDRNVPPEDSYRLIDELERHGKRFESVIYPGEAHGLADPAHQLDSYRRILTFFDRWLGQ